MLRALASTQHPHAPVAEWSSLHAHLIWVYDGPVALQGRSGTVTAFDLTAWLIRAGRVTVRMGSHRWTARAGEWLFPPPGERAQQFSANARLLSLRFRAKWPTGEDLLPIDVGLRIAAKRRPELLAAAEPLARLVRDRFHEPATDLEQVPATLADYLRLQTLFSRWFEVVITVLTAEGLKPARTGRIDPRLLAAVRQLDRQPLAKPIAETDLARSVGVSVSQLNRLFLRQFGVTSRGYFDNRRHRHAISELQDSTRVAKEIAGHLGFSSLPHFSAWFRRKQGISPREFRMSLTRVPQLGPSVEKVSEEEHLLPVAVAEGGKVPGTL